MAVTVLSRAILIHVVSRGVSPASAGMRPMRFGAKAMPPRPNTSPPPTTPPVAMKARRVHLFMCACLRGARRGVDRLAHTLVRAATADVGHFTIDLLVRRLRRLREQGRGRHDHAGLAVAALRDLVL